MHTKDENKKYIKNTDIWLNSKHIIKIRFKGGGNGAIYRKTDYHIQ